MGKISIIVPVYNVEKYINRCLESLINQTYHDIEIILVNDGSTDSSGKICNDYSKIDSRIKVIHKDNGGLSDARNFGLEAATGKYVLFVDSDDYISEDSCQQFILAIGANLIDIAMGDVNRVYPTSKEVMRFHKDPNKDIVTGKEFIKLQMSKNSYNASACRNLYNREFLIKHKLLFAKGLLHEDEEWLPRVLLHANRVKVTGIDYYYYLIRDNSITQQKNKDKNALDLLRICKLLEDYYSVLDDETITKLTDEYILKLYFNAFYTGKLYREGSRKYLNDKILKRKAHTLKMYVQVLLYTVNKKAYYYVYSLLSK